MTHLIKTLLLAFTISISLNAQIAEIPFELNNDLVLIKLKINDLSEYKTFVFDTGATADVIDSTSAQTLGLKANYKHEASGASGKKSYDIILNQKLSLNDNANVENTLLVIADLTKLKQALGKDFDGIIGYSLINKYITKVDYDNKKIVLFDKIQDVDTTGYEAIPFKFEHGMPIPQFDISITLNNGETYTDKILLDSGASRTLIVNMPYNKKHNLTQKSGKSIVSKSEDLHGETFPESIAIKSITVGGYTLNDMAIIVSNDEDGVNSYDNYMGLLGAEVINRFDVILDYSNFMLYIKPNSSFNKTFEFPVSGIDLKKVDNDIVITWVVETSEAYKEGIRTGDKVISINDDATGNIAAYRALLKKENDTARLTIIDSEGETKKIKLKLERLL